MVDKKVPWKVESLHNDRMSPTLIKVIEEAVTLTNKNTLVIYLDGFEEKRFLVRMGKYNDILKSEQEDNIVTKFGNVMLRREDKPDKPLLFEIFDRHKASKVLR